MATPNYDINYNDERLTSVKSEESLALQQGLAHYDDAIDNINTNIKDQKAEINRYKDEQTKIQNESLQNTLNKIEQDKAEAKQDYIKEQSGAYVDWQKQSDEYGANSEKMASAGLAGSGYSESSQVSMYNTYQNRVAAARESYNRVIADYNIAMAEAKTQNSSILAEIAHDAMIKGLELTLSGLTQTTELLTQKANQKMAIKQMYHNKYMDVLDQINKENSLKEQVRVNDAAIAHQKAQEEIARAQLAEEKRQFDILHPTTTGGSSGGGSGGRSIKKTSSKGITNSAKTSATSAGIGKDAAAARQTLKGDSSGSSGGVSVDMKSVLNLGYGPISASKLNKLVSQGIVEEYQSGNKLKYRKSVSTNKAYGLYRSLK